MEGCPWRGNHNIENVEVRLEDGPSVAEGPRGHAPALLCSNQLPLPWGITTGATTQLQSQRSFQDEGLGLPTQRTAFLVGALMFISCQILFPPDLFSSPKKCLYSVVQTSRLERTFIFLLKYLLSFRLPHISALPPWTAFLISQKEQLGFGPVFLFIGLIHSLSASLSFPHGGQWGIYASSLLVSFWKVT